MTATTTHPSMLSAALAFAARGLFIAPQWPSRKFAFKGWHAQASRDADTLTSWWTTWPGANPACALGRSGLVVLDLDRHEGQADGVAALPEIEERLGVLPATATVRTGGGGLHKWFRCGVADAKSIVVAPGVELKAGVCGTPLPPSLHRSGRRYLWIDRAPVAVLPDAWAALVTPLPPPPPRPPRDVLASTGYARRAIEGEVSRVLNATNGGRNATLNIAAFSLGQLVGAGLVGEDEVVPVLLDAAAAVGLPLAEARGVVHRGVRAGAQRPRQVVVRGGGR